MTPILFALFLTAMRLVASLAPMTEERAELAMAIAVEVDQDQAFFKNDEDKVRTLALHIAVAYREGALRTSIMGDGNHSYCAFQVHDSSGGTKALTESAPACAEAGHRMLRTSFRVCRKHPIAWYAEGPRGCDSERAQRISRDRMGLAERLARSVKQP